MSSLTPEERAAANEMLAQLHEHGYADIERHDNLAPGVRIRHRGQQWSEAFEHGTGTVLAITERHGSSWSRSWGMPDIEMVVVWDKPWPFDDSSRLSQLAQYHVSTVAAEQTARSGAAQAEVAGRA